MSSRPWSQMTPTEHLDAAEAVTLSALDASRSRREVLLRVAEMHMQAAQTQAVRLQMARKPPSVPATTQRNGRADVMALEREALQDQMAADLAAVRADARRTRRRV